MCETKYVFGVVTLCILSSCLMVAQNAPKDPPMPMSFFITSAGPGDGGNLGGLAGDDAQWRKMGAAAGGSNKNWPAYLSTQPASNEPAINDRHRLRNRPSEYFKRN